MPLYRCYQCVDRRIRSICIYHGVVFVLQVQSFLQYLVLYNTDRLRAVFMNQFCSLFFWILKFYNRISHVGRSASVTFQLHTLPTAIPTNGGRNMPYLYNVHPKWRTFGTVH
jgi:hypothetical protein